jgi:4'-phosphopantetheinyl transferase
MIVRWLARGVDQVPADARWLSAAESERAAMMRFAKRRSEFLAARFAAKHAIAGALELRVDGLGSLAAIEVRHRPTGAPAAYVDGAPAPVSMSLTDRADWAVCVVSRQPGLALGCDLELVEPRSAGFVRDYLTPAEQATVRAADDPDLTANLLWSAKESALKVLETGLRRDTRTVEVSLGNVDGDHWLPLSVRPVEGGEFPGWWRRFGDFLLSVVGSGPNDPPAAFEDPDGLAAARPSHGWLSAPGG